VTTKNHVIPSTPPGGRGISRLFPDYFCKLSESQKCKFFLNRTF